jgi:hypothetical protein
MNAALDGSDGSDGLDGSKETPLDTVRTWFTRFVRTMDDLDIDLLALWAAHTHLCEELYTTPRLVLDSPVPGSGKTTVLEHLQRLCLRPIQMASVSSPALLTRMLDKATRTVLIDEADRSLSPNKPGVEELIAVINSGYKKGGTRPVLVPTKDGWDTKEMPTFSPVAMAGNSPDLPEDTKSRTIRVLLLPDLDGTAETSDWEEIESEADYLGAELAKWAELVRDQVRVNRPPLPDGCIGRSKERWGPIKRMAVAAGGRWPDIADQLIGRDLEAIEQDKVDGMSVERPAVALLRHLREIWDDEQFLPTSYLIDRLIQTHPEMWGLGSPFGKALTPQRFGRMLASAYKVHSSKDSTGKRGYCRSSLAPVARRMGIPLRDPPTRTVQAVQAVKPPEPSEPSEPSTGGDDKPDASSCCKCHRPQPAFVLATRDGHCIPCHQENRARTAS